MSVELAMLYDLALIPSKQRVAGSNPAERANQTKIGSKETPRFYSHY